MTSSAFSLPFAFSPCLSPSLSLSLSRLVSLFLCLSTHLCTDTIMNYYKQEVQKCVYVPDRISKMTDQLSEVEMRKRVRKASIKLSQLECKSIRCFGSIITQRSSNDSCPGFRSKKISTQMLP